MSSNSKQIILSKIQKALNAHKVEMPFPDKANFKNFYTQSQLSKEEVFANEFTALGGKFIYCAHTDELAQQLQILADAMQWNNIDTHDEMLLQLLKLKNNQLIRKAQDMHAMEIGISMCECLIARTGSCILSAALQSGRSLPVYAPIHITVAFTSQLVWDIEDGIQLLKEKYNDSLPSMISLTTGPSRTADIEKTLVVGVHGPKEVYVFLVDNQGVA